MTNRTDIEISVCYFLIGLDIFLNVHPLLILVLPQRFFRHLRRRRHHNRRRRRRGCARARGLTKSTSRVRSIRAARSLAPFARGEHRRFPRRAKVTATGRARARSLARERRRESPARTLTRGGQLR